MTKPAVVYSGSRERVYCGLQMKVTGDLPQRTQRGTQGEKRNDGKFAFLRVSSMPSVSSVVKNLSFKWHSMANRDNRERTFKSAARIISCHAPMSGDTR